MTSSDAFNAAASGDPSVAFDLRFVAITTKLLGEYIFAPALAMVFMDAALRHPEWAQAALQQLRESQARKIDLEGGAALLQAALAADVERLVAVAHIETTS